MTTAVNNAPISGLPSDVPTRDTLTQATGTDADTTLATNTLYTVDMSAWATADRSYTLPAAPSLNDRVGIAVRAGSSSFELLIKGNTGQTINGGSAASEWSRLFITGEAVTLRYAATNAWVVEYDGRVAQKALLRLSTSATAETANTLTQPTTKSGVWTADVDNASLSTIASDQIKTRRAGNFTVTVAAAPGTTITDAKFFDCGIYKNGTTTPIIFARTTPGALGAVREGPYSTLAPLAADDTLTYQFRSEEGSRGLLAQVAPTLSTSFSLTEQF